MNSIEFTSFLQHRVNAQSQQIEEFKSDEKYTKLEAEYETVIFTFIHRLATSLPASTPAQP